MKISRWTLLWLLIVGVLAAIWLAVITGYVTPGDIVGSFLGLVFALVVISILAIIGAVFLGIVISHRIMSGQGFTPFEEEMLKMRQEVRNLQDRVEAIAAKLGAGPDAKDRSR
ncbi:MAG TPA: hypothetical protein VEY12_04070 [Thermoplasmata archaeon]|nr:hypothetical protein [Thermoplasmata archaeon]